MSFFERATLRHLVYPASPRLVPTRLILINYWLYQRQVFYFAAGKLFLTGDNGSGKSTALTAAVTSIFDGDTSPSRMDPFGGGKRSVRYYLLGDREAGFEYDSRRAYIALEFQNPQGGFITVGLGLQASSGSREIQKWGFSLPGRVEFDGVLTFAGNGISLVSDSNEPLSKRQLRETLTPAHGRVVESTDEYAKLVRQTLYPHASDEEYRKLLELMMTLRGAKLGREVRPSEIEKMLRLSLPRLDQGILEQLREGIEGMDRHQRRLEVLENQLSAASRIADAFFEAALARLTLVHRQHQLAQHNVQNLNQEYHQTQSRLEELHSTLAAQSAQEQEQTQEQNALELERDSLEAQLQNADGALRDAESKLEETRRDVRREQERLRSAKERLETGQTQQHTLSVEQNTLRSRVEALQNELDALEWYAHKSSLAQRQSALQAADQAWTRFDTDTERLTEREAAAQKANLEVGQAREQLAADTEHLEQIMQQTAAILARYAAELFADIPPDFQLESPLEYAKYALEQQQHYQYALETTWEPSDMLHHLEPLATLHQNHHRDSFDQTRNHTREIRTALHSSKSQRLELEGASEAVPALPADRAQASALLTRAGIPHHALYRYLKPKWINPAASEATALQGVLDGLEAALLHSGVLTALVVPEAQHLQALEVLKTAQLEDVLLRIPRSSNAAEQTLDRGSNPWLEPEEDAPNCVTQWLNVSQNLFQVLGDGTWHNGILAGIAKLSPTRFIGVVAREAERIRQLETLLHQIADLQQQLEGAQSQQQQAQEQLDFFERAWQNLRDAKTERKQRFQAQQKRDSSASRFEDRTRGQVEALNALSSAQHAAQAATQTLGAVLLPLNLSIERGSFSAAQAQWAVAQNQQNTLENQQLHYTRLEAEAQRLIQTLGERQLEIAELDKNRLELEQRRENLTERVQEMRSQLENPDIKAWRERLNKVRNRASELRGQLRELSRSLARSQGELDVLQKHLPEVQLQLEKAKDRQIQSQLYLEIALVVHPRSAAALQRQIQEGQEKENQQENPLEFPEFLESLESLERSAQRLENALDKLFYAQSPALETPETFLPILDLHQPRFTLEGQSITADALTQHLAQELEQAGRLLSEEEARVFHNELVFALAEKLDERLREAREFVKTIRATLGELRFHDEQLDLELHRNATGGLADLIDGKTAPAFQPAAWLEQVGATVRELVARLRSQTQSDGSSGGSSGGNAGTSSEISFPQALEAALDYREWYGFTFYSIVADRRVEITDRKFQSRSGGERSAVLYTFMFSALGARFATMGSTAPRLIGLDEAFAGMDPHNIAALYQIMNALHLSLIATSPSDIYLSRSLDIASAYRLFRVSSSSGDGVSSIARLWNGTRALDMGL